MALEMTHILWTAPISTRCFPVKMAAGVFAAALFPLQEGIPLLERQVDIVALERIQVDVSMILGVPILKATDPVSKLRVFGHLGKKGCS